MRAFHSATRLGRPFSKQKNTSQSRSWILPVVAAGGMSSAAILYSYGLSETKDELSVRGASFVRSLRTLNAVIKITADYKLNVPNGSHDSEEYKAAIVACHK
jgi:hypothetical protein